MTTCDDIQARLAEAGPRAAAAPDLLSHLEDCADCRKVSADLEGLERGLAGLDLPDAPDALVAGTLRAVRRAAREDRTPRRGTANLRYLAGALAATVVAAAALGLTVGRYQGDPQSLVVADMEAREQAGSGAGLRRIVEAAPRPEGVPADPEAASEASFKLAQSRQKTQPFQKKNEAGDAAEREGDQAPADAPGWYDANLAPETYAQDWALIARIEAQARRGRGSGLSPDEGADKPGSAAAEAPRESRLGAKSQSRTESANAPARQLAEALPSTLGEALGEGEDLDVIAALQADKEAKNRRAKAKDEAKVKEEAAARVMPESELVGGIVHGDTARRDRLVPKRPIVSPAQAFLDRYRSLDGLTFREPTGYWANSYVPGDPTMRLLAARLSAWNRSPLGRQARLEQAVEPVRQPFDAPREAAMAVYLDADTAAIEGPTRLRLQVGLKGAERQGGRRPAMNVGLLVDPRGLAEPALAQRVRALIAALEGARQPGDRFSLTLAGPGGGLLVAPDDFRHGPLQVALERLFGDSSAGPATVVDLPRALALASDSVRRGDDPTAVLGSSLVLLATAADLAADLADLEAAAHGNAVVGIALSVVGLGGRENLSQIDRLVAAGQGNRRILDRAQAADGLIDRELHAASRAVARALRLRIRLAPGVKLIDVLGSRPLGEPQAALVREAEQAIDRRLARNLGIEADRGADEEGIQIVIPSFGAGDDHVILLDLVAEAPGPLAEVTLRYKDLVELRNGIARASLSLERGRRAPGPLERNVLKNLAARELAAGARQAGRALAADDPGRAAARLAGLRGLLDSLRREVPGWAGDADLAADIALLDDYLAVLGSPLVADARQRRRLAESLTYAAFRKLQPTAR